jgi:hypothetical protein
MNGKIDRAGLFLIERSEKKMKRQECPFGSSAHESRACGDWCPLFGEPGPEIQTIINSWDKQTETVCSGRTVLAICQKTLYFDSFTDERVKA